MISTIKLLKAQNTGLLSVFTKIKSVTQKAIKINNITHNAILTIFLITTFLLLSFKSAKSSSLLIFF